MIPAIFNNGSKKTPAAAERPIAGTLKVKGKLKNAGRLKKELDLLSMFQGIKESDGGVEGIIVESTDRNKNPHLYIRFVFSKSDVEATYSITTEVANPSLRKLKVMKSLFTLLSLLETKQAFEPDREDLYSQTMEAFDTSAAFADVDALRMKYELEKYTAENEKMKAEIAKLKEEKEGINHELLELEKRSQAIEERLRKLESMTDEELDREIVQWVENHYGKLNESRFCEALDVPPQRLEERLDSLSKRGVIRLV